MEVEEKSLDEDDPSTITCPHCGSTFTLVETVEEDEDTDDMDELPGDDDEDN